MKVLIAEYEWVACATLASMTGLTRVLASQAAAIVHERVQSEMASAWPGVLGMRCDLVWDKKELR